MALWSLESNYAVVKALCDHGSDMQVLTNYDANLLHLAAGTASQTKKHTVLDYIIKSGKVDINARDEDGDRPLDYSI